jgi:hypothetical protein
MRYEQFSVNELVVNKIVNPYGQIITPGANPSGGLDYYVDLNTANATKDGLSWGSAFATIAAAITASNASIGLSVNRWWARRNRIFVVGDGITESLTVLPEKCDIIGLGSDLYPFPRVIGAHAISLAKVACRFINMGFQATGTGDLFVIPAGCHGLQFLGCTFTAATAGNTKALEITDSAHVLIEGCKFLTSAGALTTSIFAVAISIEGTASIHDLAIKNNWIFATKGVAIANGTLQGSVVSDNYVRVTSGLAFDDDSDDVAFVNNRIITATADLVVANACDWNEALAVGNFITTATGRSGEIPIKVVMTS